MCGQDRNIVNVSYFLYEIIPFTSHLCFLLLFWLFYFHLFIYHRSAGVGTSISSCSFFLFFGLHCLSCPLIYATGTKVSLTFLKMIKQADTPCQFIRQVLIMASKSHCHTGFITTAHYQSSVGVYKMIMDVDQVLLKHRKMNVPGAVHILHLTLSAWLPENM